MDTSARLRLGALTLVIVASSAVRCREATDGHGSAFTSRGLTRASADKLKSTVVTPHLEQALTPGRNVLWCATFQLAWNEACASLGNDIGLANEPPMVPILNKKTVKRADLDEASFVALAGRIEDGILDKIDSALEAKFAGQATPALARPAEARPRDVFAYAYLFRNLEFAVPFEDLDAPLRFGGDTGVEVSCFGVASGKKAAPGMWKQLVLLDYVDENDFVIELKTKTKADRLILAKVKPARTLAETVTRVNERAAAPDPLAVRGRPVLMVPKFNFDVRRTYGELQGRPLLSARGTPTGDVILAAIQDIRFQMDEKGARLRSESQVHIGCSAPPLEQLLLFDRPFLVMLKKADARNPYFALWVDNAELLVRSK